MTQRQLLMDGPRLPPLTIWTWRMVVLFILVNWLLDIAFLVILVPPLAGNAASSRAILKQVQPAWFRSFLKSRTSLWGLLPLLSAIVVLVLVLNVLVTPAIWMAFKRRNASMFRSITYWRILLVCGALAIDLVAVDNKFPGVSLDAERFSSVHVFGYDAYLGLIAFLLLLIAPQRSPLPSNPSIFVSTATPLSYATLPYASWTVGGGGSMHAKSDTLAPEVRSRLYASQIVSITELDKVFAQQPALAPAAVTGQRSHVPTLVPTRTLDPERTVAEYDDDWVAQHMPLPPSPPPSLPRPAPTCLHPAAAADDAQGKVAQADQALLDALSAASCFPSYFTLPFDYVVRGHVLHKNKSILYVQVDGRSKPSFAKI